MGLFLSGLQKRISKAELFKESASKQEDLGQIALDQYGNTYRYVQLKNAIGARGKLVITTKTAEATLASSTDLLEVTQAAAGWTANQYAGHSLFIDDGTGEGQVRRIKSNTETVLTLEQALTTALSVADSDGTVFSENHVNISAITATIQAVQGVSVMAHTDEYYGWIQIGGVAEVLVGAAVATDTYITPGDDTTGQGKVVGGGATIDTVTLVGRTEVANSNADTGIPTKLLLGY